MASKDEREFDSGLTGGTDVPALEEDFSLEEILAEYGAGREQRLMEAVEQEARRETEPAAPPAEGGAKKPPLQTEARPRPAPQVTEKTAPPQKPPAQPEDLLEELRQDLPPSPHPITREDVVGSTVDAVSHSAETRRLPPRARSLLSIHEMYLPIKITGWGQPSGSPMRKSSASPTSMAAMFHLKNSICPSVLCVNVRKIRLSLRRKTVPERRWF